MNIGKWRREAFDVRGRNLPGEVGQCRERLGEFVQCRRG